MRRPFYAKLLYIKNAKWRKIACMVIIFLRTVVTFVALMIVMRLMGKRQIGEMQSFELVITLIIADLACVPMADVSIPLSYGLVAILALFIMHQLFALVERGGDKIKRLIAGKPSVVINKDGVDFEELRRNDLGVDDLLEAMRGAGYFSLSDVDYAIFESTGKLSALAKAKPQEGEKQSLPVLLIDEGKIQKENLAFLHKTPEWLTALLEEDRMKVKDVGVFTVDGNGVAYLQRYGKPYTVKKVDLGELQW